MPIMLIENGGLFLIEFLCLWVEILGSTCSALLRIKRNASCLSHDNILQFEVCAHLSIKFKWVVTQWQQQPTTTIEEKRILRQRDAQHCDLLFNEEEQCVFSRISQFGNRTFFSYQDKINIVLLIVIVVSCLIFVFLLSWIRWMERRIYPQ